MAREEGRRRLRAARPELASLGVRSLDLVDSVTRGDAGSASDVDLPVDFDGLVDLFHRRVRS